MNIYDLIKEMAIEPKTKQKADRLSKNLFPDKKLSEKYLNVFWKEFLNQSHWEDLGLFKIPNEINFSEIKVIDKTSENAESFSFLEIHQLVTIRIKSNYNLTIILSSLDEPGDYRFDFVAMGFKKKEIMDIRLKVSQEIMKHQDKMTVSISEKELSEFKRLRAKMSYTKHSHKEGRREESNLVGRILLDEIPLPYLEKKAKELREITKTISKLIIKHLENQ